MADLRVDQPEDLARVVAGAPPGSRVLVGAGRHVLRETLRLPPDITLEGVAGKTSFEGVVGSGRPLLSVAQHADRLAFRGIAFESGQNDWGGVLAVLGAKDLVFEDCRFNGNSASRSGGALFLRDIARGMITRCVFSANQSKEMGGALDVGRGSVVVVDRCMFFGNRSKVGGAAALNVGGSLQLRQCTFVDNAASWPKGGGALFVLAAVSTSASGFIANSVFQGKEQLWGDPSKDFDVAVTHSVVPEDLFAQSKFTSLPGNTLAAPELEDAGPQLLRLKAGSPGTGTANPKFFDGTGVDLLGAPLVRAGVADPGALARR